MKRSIAIAVMLAGLLTGWLANGAWSAELKVIQTQKTKNAVITLKSESGQWARGDHGRSRKPRHGGRGRAPAAPHPGADA